MAYQEDQKDQGQGCIQLIRCITPTPEELNEPQYVPQLEINKKAQEIIAQRFDAPISIIVYVGKMGVGKSKLATATVAALEKEGHNPSLSWFRSGVDANAVTKGVWMWSEPLQHPDDQENNNGSVLVLDCEGMGDLDENTGANLYLFCMVMSTAFAVLLRPARIEKDQCDRLYHTLRRFENMRTQHVLPNFWLMPLELSDFAYSDPNTDDDVVITKEEWIKRVFTVDEERNPLPNVENQELKRRYEYITRMLPKIDAVNIDFLPRSLTKNTRTLDVHSLLRKEESGSYLKSIDTAIRALLASGGKRFPGSTANKMFVRPAELATFMGELIDVINGNKVPNPDSLFERRLAERFTVEIERESLARFKNDLLQFATEILDNELYKRQKPLTETEIARINEKLSKKHADTKVNFMDVIIRRARYQIVGSDESLMPEFRDENERQKAVKQLPQSIQHRLNIIDEKMNDYQEPKHLIQRAQDNLTIEDIRHQRDEKEKLYQKARRKLMELSSNAQRESMINEALDREHAWRVGAAPCSCGARGGAYNILHVNCHSNKKGNLYYFNNQSNEMVCDLCRNVIRCKPHHAHCNDCGKRLHVTKIY